MNETKNTEGGLSLISTFERIRIINLKHRADRRKEITGELLRLGLRIDGDKIAFHEACRPDSAGEFPTIGTRGCFLSHLGVLREALDSGWRNLLILEDDLDFSRDAATRIKPLLDDLQKTEWSIFYGGYEQYDGPRTNGLITKARPEDSIQTAHCIAFARPALETAVPYLEKMLTRKAGDPAGGPMHVDGAYSWLRKEHPALETWLATEEIGHQRPSRTDIHSLGLRDRLPGFRSIMAVGRKIKRRLK